MLKKAYNNLSPNPGFVLLHVFFWLLFLSIPVGDFIIGNTNFPIGFLIKTIVCMGVFYFNYFVLVPRFLLRNKPGIYIFWVLVIIIVFTIIFSVFFVKLDIPPMLNPNKGPLFWGGPVHNIPADSLHPAQGHEAQGMATGRHFRMHSSFRYFPNIIMLTLHISFSAMFKIYVEWNDTFKRQKEAETEKKISELNFLKAQLNPHFFFNSLNTIFSLAIKKSDQTPVAILNLSDLMRYMLYETDKNKVQLQEEILYIENYIELQKLRLTENNHIKFEVAGSPTGILIPPLLFICFIENAFKHGVNPATTNQIFVKFTISHNEINMLVVNDINIQLKKDEASGLGIENTVKRINLYFPEKNILKTYTENDKFFVDLTLKLNEA